MSTYTVSPLTTIEIVVSILIGVVLLGVLIAKADPNFFAFLKSKKA